MNDNLTRSGPTTEAEYKAACAELLPEMKQREETFDKLQAEIEAMQEAAGRRPDRRNSPHDEQTVGD